MTIENVIIEIKARLTLNAAKKEGLLFVCLLSYSLLFCALLTFLSFKVAGLGAFLLTALWGGIFLRRFLLSRPDERATYLYLDQRLALKDRAVSYFELTGPDFFEDGQKKDLLSSQLKKGFPPDILNPSFIPFIIKRRTRYMLYSLIVVWGLIVLTIGYWNPIWQKPVGWKEVQMIEQLLTEEPQLPDELRRSLQELAYAIKDHGLDHDQVLKALQNAESTLERQQILHSEQLEDPQVVSAKHEDFSPKEPDSDQQKEKDEQDSKEPPSQPALEEDPEEQEQDKEESSKSLEKDSFGSSSEEDSQQGDAESESGQDGDGQGAGTGEGSGDDGAQGEQAGAGQGESEGESSDPGQQAGQGAEGEKPDSANPQDSGSQGLDAAEQTLSEIKEQIENSRQEQQESVAEQQNKEQQGQNDNQSAGSEEANDSDETRPEPGEKDADFSRSSEQQSEDSSASIGQSEHQVGSFEDMDQGDGPEGSLPLEFKEEIIPGDNEALDPRFTANEREIVLRDASEETAPTTSIDNVRLARPEGIEQDKWQPIPQEYRDLIN